jgi:hypothetical protein
MRHLLSKFVCFLLGHAWVDRKAIWYQWEMFFGKEVKIVCLRCLAPMRFEEALADNMFATTPLFRRFIEKGKEIAQKQKVKPL